MPQNDGGRKEDQVEGIVGFREKIVIGVIVLLLITGAAWRAISPPVSRSGLVQTGHAELQQSPEEKTPELITVHIVGAVLNPGVYQLPAGSRVYQLLEICGGFSAEADGDALNQARPLLDGEQIQITRIGEQPQSNSSGSVSKININRATADELTALPGIGAVRAGQIVDHRDKNGYFSDIREIMDVSGIGETTFKNIADLITIY
jgi:competence protein ComEA